MTTTPTDTPDAGQPTAQVWTADRIRALGAVTDLPTAARIFGLGRSLAYDLARRGEFPVPLIRAGTRYRVPVAGILTALQLTALQLTGPPLTAPARAADLTAPATRSVDHHQNVSSPSPPDPTQPGAR